MGWFCLLQIQRNLNNCFAYDLVPSVEVLTAALKAARRVNDFPTAVRVFEGINTPSDIIPNTSSQWRKNTNQFILPLLTGIKAKVETPAQYTQYLEKLEGLRTELGIALREELYPE